MIDNQDADRVARLAQDHVDEQDELLKELDRRDTQIVRLVTALQSQGLHQHFIDALLDVTPEPEKEGT